MLARYGQEHAWNGPHGSRSCDLTKLRKYGSANFANKEKSRATRLAKYGDAHFNRAKCRETNLTRYGVEYPLQNAEILQRNHLSGLRCRDYTMPSGRVVQIQGYEGHALDWLLKTHDESELLVSKTDVRSFPYSLDGKVRRYFPDIWVPSQSLVYEVKSAYTLKVGAVGLAAKADAVLQAGCSFVLLLVEVTSSGVTVTPTEVTTSSGLLAFP